MRDGAGKLSRGNRQALPLLIYISQIIQMPQRKKKGSLTVLGTEQVSPQAISQADDRPQVLLKPPEQPFPDFVHP